MKDKPYIQFYVNNTRLEVTSGEIPRTGDHVQLVGATYEVGKVKFVYGHDNGSAYLYCIQIDLKTL